MKLCIPIRYKPEGGLYSFIANLVAYLDRHGVEYTQALDDGYDALLVNSWVVPYGTVARLKRERPSLTVTHRIDGAAQDYGRGIDADREQARVNMLADTTIFQSEYSRFATRQKYKVIAQDGVVIYNAVDLTRFSPAGARFDFAASAERPRIVNVSFSTNPRKGTWKIDALAASHPEFEFVLCGRYQTAAKRPNIAALGHLDPETLARVLRSCDVFLDLTENEACPNVVLEAMASGLPILHNGSGALPELVGDAGLPLASGEFAGLVRRLAAEKRMFGEKARRRATTLFDPDTIFPRYLETIRETVRHREPAARRTIALARQGYPVMPRPLATARSWATTVYRSAPDRVQNIVDTMRPGATRSRPAAERVVGWVTYDSANKRRFENLDSFTRMRVGNVASWMNAHDSSCHHELYDSRQRYDVVVFQKMMDRRCQDEAARVRSYGGKVIFDANVNYYERWGDYIVPGTEPTADQTRDAIAMTGSADWVVADSTYLEQIVRRFTPHVTWIPDNVDMQTYSGLRQHRATGPIRMVWSGIGKKAAHLLLIRDVLADVRDLAELVLVVDDPPPFLEELERAIRCELVRFSHHAYARTLRTCDIIISPKRLVNAYEMAHTEYKITLGMAIGLPAVASPQQSYVEAISYAGGGIIADSLDDWRHALERLISSPETRTSMGAAAKRTVEDRYSTPVVAGQYLDLLTRIFAESSTETSINEPWSNLRDGTYVKEPS